MILRVIIFATIVVGNCCYAKEDDNNFMTAVRSLIYGEQHSANATTQQLSDGLNPGLLPSSAQYPSAPNSYNSYPQFTVGVSSSSSSSPCGLPQQIGTGPYRIPRWYFNPARMRCELFYWSGCCGNGNNFNTFQSCQQICEGGSLGTPQNSPGAQFLNVQQSSQIPSEWLLGRSISNNNNNNNDMNNNIHVSVSVKQFPQECCQKPFSPGFGSQIQPRWYYEGQSGICQIYLYRGFGGAGNNFRTQEECQKICKEVNTNNNNGNIANGPAPHIVIPDNSDSNVLIGFGHQQQQTINIPNIAAYTTTTFSPQFIVRTTSPQPPSIEIVLPPFPSAAPLPPSSSKTEAPPPPPQQPQFRPTTAAPLPPPPPPLPPLPRTTQRPIPLLLPVTTTTPQPLQPRATTFSTINSIYEVDPCSQEREQGVGALQLTRYFFNKETKLCEQFIFFGSASNRNNFNTLEECQNQCPESPNPCAYGTSTTLMSCAPGSVLSQTCSGQQFCHVGATPQTTVCCNKPATNIDRCSQPLNVGVGNSNLQRWYFNPLTQQCQPCFYKGLQGNENNFLSRQDCENSCAINPCKRGVPYRSQGVTVQCSATNQAICPAGYYCHVGTDSSTSVCCQALVSNPCNEILSKGEGNAALTRYYYDAEKRQCLPFNYLGTKGNTNNFLTKESCEELCPVWVNPCAKGEPLLGANSKPTQCSRRQPCQMGFYCHIGYDDETTVCCPSQNDPCSVPVSQGLGPHVMSRWYYDSALRQCKQFTYKGLRGNENNFLLRDHCEQSCPVWENPCPSGDPILGENNKPKQCFPGQDNTCPSTHWCHPGLTLASTVCCPGRQDPCVLAVSTGSGNQQRQRWYFDMAVKQCKDFVYKGIKGNANNFATKEECEQRCPVFVDPCPLTYAYAGVSNLPAQYVKCSAENQHCPASYWCHLGQSQETTVCCPNAVKPCTLPAKVQGSGELRLTRWSYDASSRACEPFEYFGIKGNQNNFLTREACESACPAFENPCKSGDPFMVAGKPQFCKRETPCPANYYCHIGVDDKKYCCPAMGGDPCGQPMDRGMGGAQLSRWYWDQSRQCCLPFSYCGQKGTQNNFLTKQDCEQTCFEIDNPCALGEPQMISPNEVRFCSISNPLTCAPSFWCHFGSTEQTTLCCPGRVEPQEVCQQPMVQGTGNGQLFRWYYNSVSQCCIQFTYRGREGNQNNFLTREECEDQCVSINVCPYGEPQKALTGGRPILCSFNGTECEPNHFCHLGLVPDENQCCPGEPTNPAACQGLPPQEGIAGPTGTQPTERWYYEVTSMSCKPFTFDGRKGNQNNFLSEADCAATCQVFVNPCSLPISMPPQSCSADNPNTCSGGSYCHIGGSPTTTICCPSEGDPCQLPLNCGFGNEALNRWYYNQQTGNCQPFIYLGMKGNQNNFLSQQQCEQSCFINPCAEGNPFIGVDGRTQTCSASQSINMCPSSYWCHVGADVTTTVCCPGASQNSCNLPMSTGEGNANLERFYFDQSSKTCRQFIYNGLKGNQNNFLTLRACQLACQPLDNPCIGQPATTPSGQVLFCSATNKDTCPVNFWCHLGATPETTVCCPGATNPCSVPLAPGTGNAGLARWYYNPDDRQCVPFQYNGKRGNQNNFLSQPECERTCPVFKNPCIDELIEKDKAGAPKECDPMLKGCSDGYFCLAGDTALIRQSFCCKIISKDPCETYLNEGEGEKSLHRWYYNPFSGTCQSFMYRGLKGNENNFLTKQLCEQTCQPLSNVCFGGQEPFKIGTKISSCQSNSDCPHSHYCHLGAEKRASVCCKKQGNPCEQQLMIGIGDAKLQRFYYSEVDDRCLGFNYSGLAGNENNFATKAQCEISCPGFRDYCPHGKPLLNKGKPTMCGIDTACQKGFVCHVTKKETKSVCCPDPAAFCLLPKEVGPCRGAEKRYFYNRQTGICEKFLFGGCLGNLNNFESLESCTEVCCDKEQLCLLSIDRGACGGQQTRYAFNRQTSQCVSFTYTGCGGNLNNFETMADCMATCGNVGFRR